jgi:hypothetical protein
MTAQTVSTGAITGTVTDMTGGVIPNAAVTATNADTGQARTGTTNAAGQYQFGLLPSGNYRVKFTASGFKTVEVPITVSVTETETVDRALEVGAQGAEVTVEANVETIQTASSAMGTVVNNNAATALPLTTRNYTNLIGLSAGANASVNNASGFGAGGVDTAVNGALTTQNNYMMDGVALATAEGGSVVPGFYSAIPVPNPDTLQEFKIQTSLYDAGYGRNAGGNVNVVTKAGTNSIHGTAYEFFRNTDLNATDFFRNRQCGATPTSAACAGGAKQIFNQNQWGGTVGGPVKKDKFFFFMAYQQTGQKNGSVSQGFSTGVTLPPVPVGPRGTTSITGVNDPTAAAFQAALGAALCPGNKASPSAFLTNPGGAGAGQGTQVACDGSNISPYAMRYLQGTIAGGGYAIPSSGTAGFLSGLAYTNPALDHQKQGMLNLDYVLNSKNTLSSKYYRSQEPQNINFFSTPSLPGLPGNNNYGYQNGIEKLTTIVSNTVVNEARISILRGTNGQTQNPSTGMYATNIYPTCGTAAASQGQCANPGQGLLGGNSPLPPQISVQGQFLAYGGTNNVTHNQTTYGVGDQLSWTKGKHTFRFGGEWEDTRWTWVGSWLSHGIMAFQTFNDFLIGLPGACGAASSTCNGAAYSNVLNTTNYDVASGPKGIVHGYRMKNANAFVQDDFKLSQRLTINLGVRWEYDGLLSDKYGNAVNMWPSQVLTVPMPVTSQIPSYGQPLFPTGGTYAGWVVPSNFSTATYGPLTQWPGLINSGNLVSVKHGTPLDDFAPRIGFAYQPGSNNRLVLRGGFGFFFDRMDGNQIVHSIEQSAPYAPTLDQGASTNQFSSLASPFENYHVGQIPERWVNFAQANLPNAQQIPFQLSSNITSTSMYQYMQTPLSYEWNFNMQYELAARWVLEVGYVGSHGIHQSENLQALNEAYLATPGNPVWGQVTENTVNNATLRVPFLGMSPTGMQYATTNGAYKFNSLQATIRKQLSNGLTFQAAYTWSRAFNDFEGPSGSNSGDPRNLQQQYGLNTQYRPQRLVINYQYNVPSGYAKNSVAKAFVGGWSLAGVTTIQDGFPLIIADSRGGAIYGMSGATAVELSRAQIASGATYSQIPTSGPLGQRLGGASLGLGYINPAAFTTIPIVGADPNVAGTGGTGWGNVGIGPILGPGQFNFDMSLIKNTRVGGIHEDGQLQFRAEFFNLFNHPQFSNPATNIALSNFGQITSMSVNPRLMQLALKYVF